ncbi:MAG: PAS domain S-box protein [Acidobacteriota bacterium]|nr:PAS domain S-box protein [Acidobacteriota bacterium]
MDNRINEQQKAALPTLRDAPLAEPYKEIFTHSNDAIAIIDGDGQYLEQNPAHRNMMGYSDEELYGKTPAIHMPAEEFELIKRELVDKGAYRGEVTSRAKNGNELQIELSAFAMRNASGDPICYVGIKRDISARKRNEEALRRSESELADFFENAAIGLHWVGANGYVVRVNQAELDLLGYTREDYIGHHISEFHADQEVIKDILTRLQRGEAIHDYGARLRCKDGGIKHVRINSSVYCDNGEFVHTRCLTHDVTDKKRAEQRLALQYAVTRTLAESTDIVESAPEILRAVCENLGWELGLLWRVERESDRLVCVNLWQSEAIEIDGFEVSCRNFKFEKGVGLPGRIWATGEPAWIPNALEDDNFPRASIAAKAGLHGAFGFPILLGREVIGTVEFFSREIREPDPELLRMVASIGGQIGQFQERKRAEADLAKLLLLERSARAEAEQASRLKDEFLATVSHELRTPLNAMMGWARMLRSGRLDTESRDHALEVIERNAWAQKQIIEDILDVSRVITGKLQLNLSPVDLKSVVDAALDAVRPALEAKEIRIKTTMDPRVRVIAGDSDRLQQVIWNLLSNATKFTPAGGEIEVSGEQIGNNIQIRVGDTGSGIDPEFLPYVFERFRQADGSTTRTHGGLGLGLAIVRHLVELHGGSIKADNRKEGQGAILTISLPLPSGELRTEDLPEVFSRAPESSPALPDLNGFRILLVDDEADALDLIAIDLTACGAKVTCFERAADALEALGQSDFDLLISDIGMPDHDGYEFIRSVRAREAAQQKKKIPAVALTAYARVQDRMRALIAGYDTHVAKPLESGELVTVVASLVGRLVKK